MRVHHPRSTAAAIIAAVLSCLSVAGAVPALAHAEVTAISPANGAMLNSAPTTITVQFSEPATFGGAAVTDKGVPVASKASMTGARLTVHLLGKVPNGVVTLTWRVTADDGHKQYQATSFTIGPMPAVGPSKKLVTTPKVAATINATRPGCLQVQFARSATSGEVLWTDTASGLETTWPMTSGSHATARGVLPFAGKWNMAATLNGAGGSVLIVAATASMSGHL